MPNFVGEKNHYEGMTSLNIFYSFFSVVRMVGLWMTAESLLMEDIFLMGIIWPIF